MADVANADTAGAHYGLEHFPNAGRRDRYGHTVVGFGIVAGIQKQCLGNILSTFGFNRI